MDLSDDRRRIPTNRKAMEAAGLAITLISAASSKPKAILTNRSVSTREPRCSIASISTMASS